MEKSRTEYSTMNTVVAMISRIAAILMGFVTRVVFTHTLSESYVGINGLFTDILNVLSLTELGVETAISYALYRPIAQGDIRKQQILMRMFRTFYRITAGCVVVLGLSIIPFFDVLMKNRPDVDHLMLIYFLYLANSVVSYLLVYKRASVKLYCSFIPDGISDLTGYLSDRHFIYDTQLYFFPEYLYCMYTAL